MLTMRLTKIINDDDDYNLQGCKSASLFVGLLAAHQHKTAISARNTVSYLEASVNNTHQITKLRLEVKK